MEALLIVFGSLGEIKNLSLAGRNLQGFFETND
jgi:hypothetical protein